jgi:hypothetical protein
LKESAFSAHCIITSVEPANLGQIQPGAFQEFNLQLFPKICGIAKIMGIKVWDTYYPNKQNKSFDFYKANHLAELTAEY